MTMVNREVHTRVWYVSRYGQPELRNAALARLAMLREAVLVDRRFPSRQPMLPIIETECWTWWHQVSSEPVNSAA